MSGKIKVVHVSAPTCWWSWGYEALFNRLHLVYGDQIDILTATFCVYDDWDEYLKHNDLKGPAEMESWAKESAELMGVPIFTSYSKLKMPKSVMPASLAVIAARAQGPHKAARFQRALLRRFVVEGRDVTQAQELAQAAAEAGLDPAALQKALQDQHNLHHAYEAQGEAMPHLPLGYYNVAVSDGDRRTVMIDHAFEPSEVEGAIDWMSGGKLRKSQPADVVAYLRAHGPAPVTELCRVFALDAPSMGNKLNSLEEAKKAKSKSLAGHPHWEAA
jgi:protein-disulfide isomerase-like protein with CxxC motif